MFPLGNCFCIGNDILYPWRKNVKDAASVNVVCVVTDTFAGCVGCGDTGFLDNCCGCYFGGDVIVVKFLASNLILLACVLVVRVLFSVICGYPNAI